MKYFKNCSLFLSGLFFLSFLLPFNDVFAQTDILTDGSDDTYHISVDTTWTKDTSPYVVYQDVAVESGVTLTILPGTVIKFRGNRYLDIFGKLIANGTASEKIYFTSLYDDSIGGDTDGYGSDWMPEYSKWGGIEILNGGVSKISDTEISYAKYTLGIYFGNGSLDSVIISNCDNGMILQESTLDIKNAIFSDIFVDILIAYSNSTISINSTDIKNVGGKAFEMFNGSTLNLSDSNIENINGDYIAEAINNSSVNINNSKIENIPNGGWAAFPVYNNSILSITNSSFNDITADTIFQVFNGSTLNFSSSTLKNVFTGDHDGAIEIYNGSNEYASTTFNIINSEISDGNGVGLEIFGRVNAEIKNTKINNFLEDGIQVFSNPIVRVSRSEIIGNNNGIQSWGADVEIKDSVITNNSSFGIYNNPVGYALPIKATDNWWGDKSGPLNAETNASGTANQVSSNVEFVPWLTSDPNIKKKTPVVIIPGIMGTKLVKNYGDNGEVWPNIGELLKSFTDSFLDDLSFNSDGTENPDFPMTLGDIMRKVDLAGATVSNTWDGLISTLISGGYTEGTDLFVFPYDWRKSNAESASILQNKIDAVLAETGMNKVDIVAHSMGGLVAQKYISDNSASKVDKLIFIGTPHLGAPKAFKALMYGDDMGIKKLGVSLLHSPKIREISQNFPSVFDLLPSRVYIEGNTNPDSTIPNKYIYDATASTSKWLDYDETKNFIINHGGNELLFPQAESLHESTDDFDLSGADVYNFSGCGTTKTIGSIIVKKKKSWTSLWRKIVEDYSIDYVNGDETVPLSSAVGPFGDRNYYIKGATHTELPSAEGVPETIFSILSGISASTTSNISTSNNFCDITGHAISTHSPVTLDIYDDLGNHTGPVEVGDIEYGIPGVSYDIIGTDVFAFLPEGRNYRIVVRATDTGAYDFYITKLGTGGTKVSEAYWNEIPLTTISTNSKINISSTSTDYVIETDQNGDGIFESSSTPSAILSSSTIGDLVPSQSTNTISDGIVSLSAVDDNAGVLKTEYSFDGNTWTLYTTPFSAFGETVSYFSTDNAGNIEPIQSINIPAKEITASVAKIGNGGPEIVALPPILPSVVANTLVQEKETIQSDSFVIASETKQLSFTETQPPTSSLVIKPTDKNKNFSMNVKKLVSELTSIPKISKSTTKFSLTASVESSNIDIKSIIKNTFHKFFGYLSSLLRKI